MAWRAEETAAMNITEAKARPDVHNADKHRHHDPWQQGFSQIISKLDIAAFHNVLLMPQSPWKCDGNIMMYHSGVLRNHYTWHGSFSLKWIHVP